VSEYPIEFAELEKGTTISREVIEQAYNISANRDPKGFALKQLALAQMIESRRPDLLCRSVGDTIRVMSDAESEERTWDRYVGHIRGTARELTRRARINRDGFSDEEKRLSEFRDTHMSGQVLHMRKQLRQHRAEELPGPDPQWVDPTGPGSALPAGTGPSPCSCSSSGSSGSPGSPAIKYPSNTQQTPSAPAPTSPPTSSPTRTTRTSPGSRASQGCRAGTRATGAASSPRPRPRPRVTSVP
jgi:hypothetical protein